MAQHNNTGKWGEDAAVELLVSKGYAIMERNWRLNHLELDIVAMKGDRLVFVEVKTRANPDDDPIAAVGPTKIRRIVSAANAFINARKLPHEPQFDIVGISGTEESHTIEHIEDAFIPPLRTY